MSTIRSESTMASGTECITNITDLRLDCHFQQPEPLLVTVNFVQRREWFVHQ